MRVRNEIKKDPKQKKVEILIVEDSPTQAVKLQYLLVQNNYRVSVAQNGVEALTIMKKSKQFAVIRGVPLLQDIPLLGILFSSKDFEERATEVMFIITPSISSGGIPNKEMIENIREKHEPPVSPESIQKDILE